MKYYKAVTLLACTLMVLLSVPTQALQISSLAEIANEQGTAVFTVKNTNEHRIFLNIGMYELSVKDGNIEKMPYTRDNLAQWKINVHPARTIIEPGFEKDFRVTLVTPKDPNQKNDALYQVAFVPTPYFSEGEPSQHAVQMAVGFAGLFIVPGEETPPQLQGQFDGKVVQLSNPGPNAVRAQVDFCGGVSQVLSTHDCRRNVYLLSGRTLSVTKPEAAPENKRITVEAKSLEGEYRQTLELGSSQ